MDHPQLQELVDAPMERLDVEYKAWLDLRDSEVKADLAKHFCAIANHGGGFVVFGIADDMTPVTQLPPEAGPYDHDTVSAIVSRFLTPEFQVTVHTVTAAGTGIDHPVVWVPPLQGVPVCSKRSGPKTTGKAAGIDEVTHYTRAPGPRSVPVTTPELWRPIIRSCVLHDRQTLLAALEPLLRQSGSPVTEPGDALRRWHEAAHRKFLEVAEGDRNREFLKRAHYQFSYRIDVAGDEELGMAGLVDELRKVANEVMQFVNSGWPMFCILNANDVMPSSTVDPSLDDDEFLEVDFVSADGAQFGLSDFWRVSPCGMATIVRAYQEDRFPSWGHAVGSAPGTWFWLRGMAQEIAEMIHHAHTLASRFEVPETVTFRAEWLGLRGRVLGDPENPLVHMRSQTARDDRRVFETTVPVAGLDESWSQLTAQMLSRVLRVFDANASLSPQDIRTLSAKFRK